jgi:tRNA-modifying protein YgfZ
MNTPNLQEYHRIVGAKVADDGIPLYFTDLTDEYHAVLNNAVLLDRSHEARLKLTGSTRAEFLQRMSTNDVLSVPQNAGRPTIFTSPTGRVIDRVWVFHTPADAFTLFGGPGRLDFLTSLLRRQIFFGDDVQLESLQASTRQFALHGPTADAVIAALHPAASSFAVGQGVDVDIARVQVFIARRKPYHGAHWMLIVPVDQAVNVWKAVLDAGKPHGLSAAGSLTYNTLRIRSGRPGFGRELTEDFIPLELGLWDEVSFQKGCYTGQEIIARMESRGRLAKTIVALKLSAMANVPVDLLSDGKRVGTLTSSVTAPDDEVFGIGFVKPSLAQVGQVLSLAGDVTATITALPGVQPPELQDTGETQVQPQGK